MAGEVTIRRKRVSSTDDFLRFLAHFDSDPVRAWQAYDDLRRRLVLYFEHNRDFDAEELADEALERIARRFESVEIASVAAFAFGVARHLRYEASRRAIITTRLGDLKGAEAFTCTTEDPEEAVLKRIDFQRNIQRLVEFLGALDAGDRRLLLLYYPSQKDNLEEQRRQLAVALNLSLGALRTRVARLRDKLQGHFEDSARPPREN